MSGTTEFLFINHGRQQKCNSILFAKELSTQNSIASKNLSGMEEKLRKTMLQVYREIDSGLASMWD